MRLCQEPLFLGLLELFAPSCVYSDMRASELEREAQFAALRRAYEDAFREFSSEVSLLHSLVNQSTAGGRAVEEAQRRVERARAAYRERRDLLARFLLLRGAADAAANGPGAPAQMAVIDQGELDQDSRVERLAYQLWEEAGRPLGKANEHWRRAEELIHHAA